MPTATTNRLPEVGQLVVARGRRFIATGVSPSQSPNLKRPQNLVTLSSVEDDSLGEELQVIWELELDAENVESEALPEPTEFGDPGALQAFRDAVLSRIFACDVKRPRPDA